MSITAGPPFLFPLIPAGTIRNMRDTHTWGCLETRSQRQTFLLDKACPLPYRSLHRRHTQTHKNRPCSNAHRAGHADLEQTCRHQRCRPPQTLSNTQAYPQRGSLSMAESGDSVAFSRRRGWECWTNASLGLGTHTQGGETALTAQGLASSTQGQGGWRLVSAHILASSPALTQVCTARTS